MKKPTIIFDGLTHPDFNNIKAIEKTITYLKREYNVEGALAVPLPGQVKDIIKYIENCKLYNFFQPVGLFDPHDPNIEKQVMLYKKIDCIAIKVHPRFSEWDWTSLDGLKIFNKLMCECNNYNLPILFCTYFSSNKGLSLTSEPMYRITDLLSKYDQVKLLLLHGGGPRVLEYLEHFKYWDQILIDISYTLTKYDGSSVDLDLAYAFKNLDQKLSFGSDIPYCDYNILINKINTLAYKSNLDMESEKIHNIMYKNIVNFLNINL